MQKNSIFVVPSRLALIAADETNKKNAHENMGFLSEEFGFLPKNPPLLNFPKSHQAWDEIALELPKLYQTLTLREGFTHLPLLDASETSLDNKYLMRAATLLGVFSHAYYWLNGKTPIQLPSCILQPWQQISTRLGKEKPFLSYAEHVLYNWQLRDINNHSRILDNFELLIVTVARNAEKFFLLAMTEMAAISTPMIGAMVRAQEAVVNKDIESLKNELLDITEVIHKITASFLKISPSPYSQTFVDPIVWGKCVSDTGQAWIEGTKGPGPSAAPYFHLLDSFIGRTDYHSMYGEEMLFFRRLNSLNIKNFLEAIEKISVKEFVQQSNNSCLKGIFYQMVDTYAGENGLLGIHKPKVYSYTATTFKTGRMMTIGGAQAQSPFINRVWERISANLDDAEREREKCKYVSPENHIAFVKSITNCNKPNSQLEVKRIILDIENSGITYTAGDRCGILPENNEHLISRTLQALGATEDTLIHINKTWRNALKLRPDSSMVSERILLADFLKYAKIRPLLHSIIESLYKITVSPLLKNIMDVYKEDQWELWDILDLISDSYDVTRLWRPAPWHKENISNIVPPEEFRLYSISSDFSNKNELELTIATLKYKTENIPGLSVDRFGSASYFSNHISTSEIKAKKPIAIKIVKPQNFKLPEDIGKPIVMFAGGTGISACKSLILERIKQEKCGNNWLFYGVRTESDFYYQEELAQWSNTNKLRVNVKISGEDLDAHYEKGHFTFKKGKRGHLNDVMLEEENAKLLWEFLCNEKEGGKNAYFYICGAGGFADSIYNTLEAIACRFLGSQQQAETFMYRMMAENRYMQDTFTTFAPAATAFKVKYRIIDMSEIVLHNNDKDGHWIIIDDEVYDVSKFIHLHPGGDTIITSFSGMNASKEYKAVRHHQNSAINAMLSTLKIGGVKKLNFGTKWGIGIIGKKLDYISLEQLYNNWLSYLYLIIEMENIQNKNIEYYKNYIFNPEVTKINARQETQAIGKLMNNFLTNYFDVIISNKISDLWRMVVGLCASNKNFFFMDKQYEIIKSSIEIKKLQENISAFLEIENENSADFKDYFDFSVKHMNEFFYSIKMQMRDGIKLFEHWEDKIIENSSDQLVEILEKIITIPQDFLAIFNKLFDQKGTT